jgi:hypothetical protein
MAHVPLDDQEIRPFDENFWFNNTKLLPGGNAEMG